MKFLKLLFCLLLAVLTVCLFSFLFKSAREYSKNDVIEGKNTDMVEPIDSTMLQIESSSVIDKIIQKVSEIPSKIKEEVTAPIVDTLISKVLKEEDTGDATVFRQKSKTLPINVWNIRNDEKGITFDTSLQTNHYGNVTGSINLNGSSVDWQRRYGYVSSIRGKALANIKNKESEASGVTMNTLYELIKALPDQREEISEETPIQGAICLDSSGKFVLVKSDSMSTLSQMKEVLQTKNIEYAIFIKGHLAYNCSAGLNGITIDFISHESSQRPTGYSQTLW